MVSDSYTVYNKGISNIEKNRVKGIMSTSMVHNPVAHSGCTSPERSMKELKEAMQTLG